MSINNEQITENVLIYSGKKRVLVEALRPRMKPLLRLTRHVTTITYSYWLIRTFQKNNSRFTNETREYFILLYTLKPIKQTHKCSCPTPVLEFSKSLGKGEMKCRIKNAIKIKNILKEVRKCMK